MPGVTSQEGYLIGSKNSSVYLRKQLRGNTGHKIHIDCFCVAVCSRCVHVCLCVCMYMCVHVCAFMSVHAIYFGKANYL